MKTFRILLVIIFAAIFSTQVRSQGQVHPYKVVFMIPPPMVQIALEDFLETNETALKFGLYHTGFYLNMCGTQHSGYGSPEFSPVTFQAVCRSYNGNYWHVGFDAMGNFLFIDLFGNPF